MNRYRKTASTDNFGGGNPPGPRRRGGGPAGTPGAARGSEGQAGLYAFMLLMMIEYIGLAGLIPLLKVTHFATLLALGLAGFALLKNGPGSMMQMQTTKLLVAFLFFTALSIIWAIVSLRAYLEFRYHLAYFFMFIIGFYMVSTVKKIDRFLLFFLVCHCALVLLNLHKLGNVPRIGFFRAGYFLGDGNDFAWGLIVVLPFAIYFLRINSNLLVKGIAGASLLLLVFGIIGTASRGAAVAGFAILCYFVFKNRKNKIAVFLMLVAAVVVIWRYAPSSFTERVESIRHYDQDSSAVQRIQAWKSAVKMAIDFPLGAGAGNFQSAYGRIYREEYFDPRRWGSGRWISPHSIYFSVLGEYGFLGLALYLYLLYSLYRNNDRMLKLARENGTQTPEQLFLSVNMSLVGFAVGGAFLGGVTYPHLYVIAFLSLRLQRILEDELSGAAALQQRPLQVGRSRLRPSGGGIAGQA